MIEKKPTYSTVKFQNLNNKQNLYQVDLGLEGPENIINVYLPLPRNFNASDMDNPKWVNLVEVPGSLTKANITLPIRTPTEVRIRAINAIGHSTDASRLVKPPLYYHTGGWKHFYRVIKKLFSRSGFTILPIIYLCTWLACYSIGRTALLGHGSADFRKAKVDVYLDKLANVLLKQKGSKRWIFLIC